MFIRKSTERSAKTFIANAISHLRRYDKERVERNVDGGEKEWPSDLERC